MQSSHHYLFESIYWRWLNTLTDRPTRFDIQIIIDMSLSM